MRLILRDEVDHLGRRGDIVNVARGYARNFLLPKRLAMEVNDENLRIVEKEKKIYEEKLAKEKVEAEKFAENFTGVKLSFTRRVHGDASELYGSVSATDVAEALEAKGVTVERRRIALSEPIKSLGDFEVSVKLHPEVSVTVPVTVERDPDQPLPEPAEPAATSEPEASSDDTVADGEA